MKKTYIAPESLALDFRPEDTLLATSVDKGEGTVDGPDSWTRKRSESFGKNLWEQ